MGPRILVVSLVVEACAFAFVTACQPAMVPQPTNQQPPQLAPVHSTPSPAQVAAPAPPQLPPVDAGPPAVEELFIKPADARTTSYRDFRIDPLGSVALLCDGAKIRAIADGDRLEAVQIPDPLEVVNEADPMKPMPESIFQWDYVEYVGQWPNELWAIARKAGGTGYPSASALLRWSAGAWHAVFYDPDIVWAGLTPKHHALVFRSFFQDCDATVAMQSSRGCPHGVSGFQAFDADGKFATDAPQLPPGLAPAAWSVRPEVAALLGGEVLLSRTGGKDLPRKIQHLLVHWTEPQARGALEQLHDLPEDFSGALKVQSTRQIHVVSTYPGSGYRREGSSWKPWSPPPDTTDVFADSTLWAATREGKLWCSRNGDEWQEVTLGLPAGKDRVIIKNIWRGATATLYAIVFIGADTRMFRVRDVTQCR